MPMIPVSRKSPPSWKGPRNIRYMRKVSAPHFWRYSSGTTTLPRDFDIFAPSFTMSPCARNLTYGSSNGRCPRSLSAIVTKREYSRCSTACSLPPMYDVTGSHALVRFASNGRSSNSVEG